MKSRTLSFYMLAILNSSMTCLNYSYAWSDQNTAESNIYCKSVNGTPELFSFVYSDNSAVQKYTGATEYWCNLHLPVSSNDSEDNHSYVEVNTLANKEFTLASYALRHPQVFKSNGANPSYTYCQQVGGGASPGLLQGYSHIGWVATSASGNDGIYSNCVFGDGSSINAWTLLYSVHYPEFRKALLSKFRY